MNIGDKATIMDRDQLDSFILDPENNQVVIAFRDGSHICFRVVFEAHHIPKPTIKVIDKDQKEII